MLDKGNLARTVNEEQSKYKQPVLADEEPSHDEDSPTSRNLGSSSRTSREQQPEKQGAAA